MKTQKKQLFGGALVCAGIATGIATESLRADFMPVTPPQSGVHTGSVALVTEGDVQSLGVQTPHPVFVELPTLGVVGSYAYAHCYASSTLMGVTAGTDMTFWHTASASILQWFTPDADGKEVTISWDLTNAYGGAGYIHEYGVGTIWGGNLSGTAGSETLTLSAGTMYSFTGTVVAGSTSPGSGWVNITNTIPAPGGLALLGAAGLIGARRRRT